MSEKRTPVDTVRVEYHCDECGEPMRCILGFHGGTTVYRHQCLNGHQVDLPKSYPHTAYVPVEPEPAGTWVASYTDGSAVAVFGDELSCLRHAIGLHMDAKFVPDGERV